jgi:large subunit ribosomal protein L28
MAHVCFFTGKRTESGWKRSEKGARRNGGVGNKIKGRSKRKVKPNLKRLRIVVDGVIRTEWVSTTAIKKGWVVKPPHKKITVAAKA